MKEEEEEGRIDRDIDREDERGEVESWHGEKGKYRKRKRDRGKIVKEHKNEEGNRGKQNTENEAVQYVRRRETNQTTQKGKGRDRTKKGHRQTLHERIS